MASDMELVRDSLNAIRDDVNGIRDSIGKIYDKLDQQKRDRERELKEHVKSCLALAAYMKKPSSPPSSSRFSWLALLTKLGPFILAAALGLLGFGFYWGSKNTDKLEDEIAAVKKLIKDNTDEPHPNN